MQLLFMKLQLYSLIRLKTHAKFLGIKCYNIICFMKIYNFVRKVTKAASTYQNINQIYMVLFGLQSSFLPHLA